MKQYISTKKILIISGPTASGKSDLALEIATKMPSVIINADSIQLYKNLPILSSQPNSHDTSICRHELYGTMNYDQKSSVNLWLDAVQEKIKYAHDNSIIPIVVGGTGLYISKLINGINEIPQAEDSIKKYCQSLLISRGRVGLIEELVSLGESKESIINLDKQRLSRRLEVFKHTGRSIESFYESSTKKFFNKEQFVHVSININRKDLYKKCDNRFLQMLAMGALEEVNDFLKLEPSPDLSIYNTIGFLQIKDYLQKKLNKEEFVYLAQKKTRNYAKRQITWFKNQFEDKIEVCIVSRETIQKIIQLI